jgi:hypothetical protein
MKLSEFSRHTSSDYASPENAPYVKFTVTVKNGGTKAVDMSLSTVSCSRGEDGRASESVFDDGLDGSPTTHLRPGRTSTFSYGCELRSGESYLQVEASPDWDHDTAIFAGSVK